VHGKRRRTLRRGSRKEGRQAFDPRTSLPPLPLPLGVLVGLLLVLMLVLMLIVVLM